MTHPWVWQRTTPLLVIMVAMLSGCALPPTPSDSDPASPYREIELSTDAFAGGGDWALLNVTLPAGATAVSQLGYAFPGGAGGVPSERTRCFYHTDGAGQTMAFLRKGVLEIASSRDGPGADLVQANPTAPPLIYDHAVHIGPFHEERVVSILVGVSGWDELAREEAGIYRFESDLPILRHEIVRLGRMACGAAPEDFEAGGYVRSPLALSARDLRQSFVVTESVLGGVFLRTDGHYAAALESPDGPVWTAESAAGTGPGSHSLRLHEPNVGPWELKVDEFVASQSYSLNFLFIDAPGWFSEAIAQWESTAGAGSAETTHLRDASRLQGLDALDGG